MTIAAVIVAAAGYMASAGENAGRGLMRYVDTRVGTAASETRTAGLFGRNTEELGQVLPAVLEPNGMNFWTPQTQDTELKCKAPYYYRRSGRPASRTMMKPPPQHITQSLYPMSILQPR